MKKLNLKIKDMPYAAEEALNRLRVNIKFCGKNTKKIVITSSVSKSFRIVTWETPSSSARCETSILLSFVNNSNILLPLFFINESFHFGNSVI